MCSQILIFFILFLSLLVSIMLYFFSFLMSSKVSNKNKLMSFECGFSTVGSLYSSFSVHFFSLMVMFVLFELEVVLLLGCLYSIGDYILLFLLFFILLGIYLEYYLGKLSWMV